MPLIILSFLFFVFDSILSTRHPRGYCELRGKANIDYLVADIDFSTMSNKIFNNVRVTSARSPQQRGYMKISVRIDVSSSCQQQHHRWRPTLIRRPHKCSPPSLKIEYCLLHHCVIFPYGFVKYIHKME